MGRSPFFTHDDVLFRLYLRHLLGLQRMDKVTCIGVSREGAGSQALMMMSAIIFARACGLTYVHTPFAEISHADRPMREWANAWEAQFNLGLGEAVTAGDNREIVNFTYNHDELFALFSVNNLTRTFGKTIQEFRRKYYSNKSFHKNDILTICVHVRRGDVTADMPHMWTSTPVVAETIREVRAVLDVHRIKHRICVLSQGDYAGVAELESPGVEFFLNADSIWSMQEAIEADILIMAKSCFSYVSALISDGIKIYEPIAYTSMRQDVRANADVGKAERSFLPLIRNGYLFNAIVEQARAVHPNRWVMRKPNGEFDCAGFERRLLKYIESRDGLRNLRRSA